MYSPMTGQSLFGVHFTPTLLLALPVYALAPSPTTLLIFYSVFLVGACGAGVSLDAAPDRE